MNAFSAAATIAQSLRRQLFFAVLLLPRFCRPVEYCSFAIQSTRYLPNQFDGVIDLEFYKKFVDADGVPIMGSTEVGDLTLMNFGKWLRRIMAGLNVDVRRAVLARRQRVAVLAAGDSFCRIPEVSYHHYLSPGKPCDQPGAHGVTFRSLIIGTEGTADGTTHCDYRGNAKSGRVVLHEFAHAVNFAIDETPLDEFKRVLDSAYRNALDRNLLDGVKDQGRPHYFTWAFLTYIGANECRQNLWAPRDKICNRTELQYYDSAGYYLIQSILPSIGDWTFLCDDTCDPTKITKYDR